VTQPLRLRYPQSFTKGLQAINQERQAQILRWQRGATTAWQIDANQAVRIKTGMHGCPRVRAATQTVNAHHRRTGTAFFNGHMVHEVKTHPISHRAVRIFLDIKQTPIANKVRSGYKLSQTK
jgi:hypothetical protein